MDLEVWALSEPRLRNSGTPFLHVKDSLRIGGILSGRSSPVKLGFNASLGCYHRSELAESSPHLTFSH